MCKKNKNILSAGSLHQYFLVLHWEEIFFFFRHNDEGYIFAVHFIKSVLVEYSKLLLPRESQQNPLGRIFFSVSVGAAAQKIASVSCAFQLHALYSPHVQQKKKEEKKSFKNIPFF